jgi:hypothetical protein
MDDGNAFATHGHDPLWMWGVAALLCFAVYRRLRRNFGRQALRPVRMGLRIAVFALICVALAPRIVASSESLIASLVGAVAGVAIAMFASRRTRFEWQDARLYYLPHTTTGIAISLLFVGRLIYRVISVAASGGPVGGAANRGLAPNALVQGPLTLSLLFVVVGYYVYYYGYLVWKSQHVTPNDIEPPAIASDEPS